MSDWLRIPAFAKINLGLELLGPRPDGYTEITTLYQTVGLCDVLRLRLRGSAAGIKLRVLGDAVPADRRNLVSRALALARRRFGIRPGVEVEVEKNIPVGRGLGGGSSDAAAALVGLLRLAGRRVELAELLGLGARLGADVPFFFIGGRALGVGRGDEVYALEDLPRRYCVLVCPPWPISTRQAYAWVYPEGVRRGTRRLTRRRRRARMSGFSRASVTAKYAWGMGNDFEAVVFPRYPELARIKRRLAAAGAELAALTGSGSTVFGLFQQRARAVRAAGRLAPPAAGLGGGAPESGKAVYLAETLSRGQYARATALWGVVQRQDVCLWSRKSRFES